MSNDYYNHGSTPINRSLTQSSLIRTEFDNVTAGFAKLPTLTANGYRLPVINSGGTAMTVSGWKIYGNNNDTLSTAYGLGALSLASGASAVQNTAFGYYALGNAIVSSFNNVAVGYKALFANTSGQSNIAVGAGALQANATGNSNIAVGDGAIGQMTSGFNNTAVGAASMNDRTSGNYNTGFGSQTLYHNVSGNENTAIGYYAAFSYTGSGITAVGYMAAAATTGTGNTALGYNALVTNTSGASNTAVGQNAMTGALSGGFNTAVGVSALQGAVTGNFNTAVGQGAMVDCTGGSSNTAIGVSAGINLTTGSQNTFVGSQAYGGNNTNSTGLGYGANVTADNQVVLGNSSVTEVKTAGKYTGGMGTGSGTATMIGAANVNTTAVGNVGAGTDDLMTYTLPANSLSANGKGVRITAWGTVANNANAKAVYLLFGGSALAAPSVTVNQLAYWRYEAIVIRTGSNAQQYQVTFENGRTALLDFARDKSALAKTDTANIIIKCTGTATADNDIVQEGMIVEFFN